VLFLFQSEIRNPQSQIEMLGIGRWKVYDPRRKAQDFFNSEVGMRMSSHLLTFPASHLLSFVFCRLNYDNKI